MPVLGIGYRETDAIHGNAVARPDLTRNLAGINPKLNFVLRLINLGNNSFKVLDFKEVRRVVNDILGYKIKEMDVTNWSYIKNPQTNYYDLVIWQVGGSVVIQLKWNQDLKDYYVQSVKTYDKIIYSKP